MNFIKIIKVLLFSSLFLSCNKSIPNSNIPKISTITIQSLKAVNLSEDMNEISTKEDEIYLIVFLIDSQNLTLQIKQEWSFENTFKKREEFLIIDNKINLKNLNLNNTQLLFFLVELDQEQFNHSIKGIIKEAIGKESKIEDLNDFAIDKLLKHDDLLDLQWIELSSIKKNTLKFSGLQLFDKFEYLLEYKVD